MESAVFGLIGVTLGAFLTGIKEWWFQSRKNQKDAGYLAIQLSCELERFAARCADVVGDDGLYHGQPDKDGCHSIQVEEPKFDPLSFNVEWKSLPIDLMDEILDLPYRAEIAEHAISNVFEYEASAPDYYEGFEERQFQYAALGIAASRLAMKLRKHANLPSRVVGCWNPVSYMEERKSAIESLRTERAAKHPVPSS